jgi:hypothetical protein
LLGSPGHRGESTCGIYERRKFVVTGDRRRPGSPFRAALRIGFAAALLLAAVAGRAAWASPFDCELPGYLAPPEEEAGASVHYHPVVAIVVYARGIADGSPLGEATALFRPPAGLGVDTLSTRLSDTWTYRQIHSHDESGVLHVEPEGGRVFRLCHLFRLWLAAAGADGPFGFLDPRKTVTVIIGEAGSEDKRLDELLAIPLDSDDSILILVEDGEMT